MVVDKRASPELVAVLDMGASAIRLVIAEVIPGRPVRFVEQASRGVLLGRAHFRAASSGRRRPMPPLMHSTVSAKSSTLRRAADPRGRDERSPGSSQH